MLPVAKSALIVLICGAVFIKPSACIFGGQPTAIGQFPHHVSLRPILFNDDTNPPAHLCSGSIVAARWIVTIAHRVYYLQPDALIAVVAEVNRSSAVWPSDDRAYVVDRIVTHPDYGHFDMLNDVAVLGTDRDIRFGPNVAAVAIGGHFAGAGANVVASGWMSDLCAARNVLKTPSAVLDPQLQHLDLKTLTNSDCRSRHPRWHHMVHEESVLCAYSMSRQRGVCDGDAGTPLVMPGHNGNGVDVLVGMLTWSDPYEMGRPDAFTRVAEFSEWIFSYINATSTTMERL